MTWRRATCALAAVAASLCLPSTAPASMGSAPMLPATVTDGTVHATTVAGGKLYLGGTFQRVGVSSGGHALLDPATGAMDGSLAKVGGGGTIQAAISDGAGGYYIAGGFEAINGVPRLGIARILANGTLDPDFDPRVNGFVYALALSGGRLYAGGNFTTVNEGKGTQASRGKLAAFDAQTGVVDAQFEPPPPNHDVYALTVHGGRVYAGGMFTLIGNAGLAAYDAATGTWDQGFGVQVSNFGGTGHVQDLLVSNGKLYVAGGFTTINGLTRKGIAVVNPVTGAVDGTFVPATEGATYSMALKDGLLYVGMGGWAKYGVNGTRFNLAALDATTGATHTAFDPGMTSSDNNVQAVAVDGDTVYAGGGFSTVGGNLERRYVAAFDAATGGVKTGFHPRLDGHVAALVAGGGRLYAGGHFSGRWHYSPGIAAVDVLTGEVDTGFSASAYGSDVRALAVGDGRVYAGGTVYVAGDPNWRSVRAFDAATGAHDAGFTAWVPGSGTNEPSVRALAYGGGRLFAGGIWPSNGNGVPQYLAALDPATGTHVQGWNGSAAGPVHALLLTGGELWVGGQFPAVGLRSTTNLGVLNPATGSSLRWVPDTDAPVYALAAGDGRLYLGGAFSRVRPSGGGWTDSPGVAAVNPATGAHDVAFVPDLEGPLGASETVRALSYLHNRLHVGGRFRVAGGSTARLASVDSATGVRDPGFAPDLDGDVHALATPFDLYAGGAFARVGDRSRGGLAAFPRQDGTASPVGLDFVQNRDAGPTGEKTTTITNHAHGTTLTIGTVALEGAGAGHFERMTPAGDDCTVGTALDGGESCTVRVRFDPSTVGTKHAVVRAATDAEDVLVGLRGESWVEHDAEVAPSALAFGSRDLADDDHVLTATIASTGRQAVMLGAYSLTGAGAAHFERLTGAAGDCPESGGTVWGGTSCAVRVAFDPSTVGAKAATLTVAVHHPSTVAKIKDLTVGLSGTGTLKQLTAAPATLPFGGRDVDDGATTTQTSTITNTGSESVTIQSVTLGGTNSGDFGRPAVAAGDCATGTVLAPNASCAVRAHFDPTTTGAKTAAITVDSDAPDAVVAVTGSGTQTALSASVANVAFGGRDIDDGPTAPTTITYTNTGTEPVTVQAAGQEGTDPGFAIDSHCAGGTVLAAGQTCTIDVTFDPTTVGAKTGTVVLPSSAGDVDVTLTGTGTQTALGLDLATLAFGARDVAAGSGPLLQAVVTNTGTEPVTLTAVALSGSDSSSFQHVTSAGAPDCVASKVLAAGQTCLVRALFDPFAVGGKTATITVSSALPALVVTLTGTGTQQTQTGNGGNTNTGGNNTQQQQQPTFIPFTPPVQQIQQPMPPQAPTNLDSGQRFRETPITRKPAARKRAAKRKTGKRAAALKRCAKLKGKKKAACQKKAKKLPLRAVGP